MPTGTAIVDFGAKPASDTKLVVAGQAGILATSFVEAWVVPKATADHTADEHCMAELQVRAGGDSIVPGVSFTIFVQSFSPDGDYGKFSIAWIWV